ncbi:hypothetical protein HYW43_02590 [Candidatus Daviesbacteria bacterium]|nr:hypothetical protein [Candidatus Daviesbacteria bacterium]
MKETKNNTKREYLPTLADLIDALTISQIKEIKFHDKKEAYAEEIKKICHDVDLIIGERNVKLNSKLIRIIIVIAQLNLHIWENKDRMTKGQQENYLKLLKLAHQLNGIRNKMKNKISEEIGDKDPSKKRTNIETDDLKGWDVSVE